MAFPPVVIAFFFRLMAAYDWNASIAERLGWREPKHPYDERSDETDWGQR